MRRPATLPLPPRRNASKFCETGFSDPASAFYSDRLTSHGVALVLRARTFIGARYHSVRTSEECLCITFMPERCLRFRTGCCTIFRVLEWPAPKLSRLWRAIVSARVARGLSCYIWLTGRVWYLYLLVVTVYRKSYLICRVRTHALGTLRTSTYRGRSLVASCRYHTRDAAPAMYQYLRMFFLFPFFFHSFLPPLSVRPSALYFAIIPLFEFRLFFLFVSFSRFFFFLWVFSCCCCFSRFCSFSCLNGGAGKRRGRNVSHLGQMMIY